MLYPDFQELVNLQSRTSSLKLFSSSMVKNVLHGNYSSPFKGHGLEFDEVRQYVYGDDVRRIDWRVSAKTSKTHVKLFSEEKTRKVLIIVDVNHYMRFGTRCTFKSVAAAKVAALLAWSAHQHDNLVGGCLFGDVEENIAFFKPKRSRQSLYQIFDHLCKKPVRSEENVSLSSTLQFIRKIRSSFDLVFIISDFINIEENLLQELQYLCHKSILHLVSINDPIDMSINKAGKILFSPDGKQGLYINTDNTNGRKNYDLLWQEREKMMQDFSKKLNLKNIALQTNEDLYLGLFNSLGQIYSKK